MTETTAESAAIQNSLTEMPKPRGLSVFLFVVSAMLIYALGVASTFGHWFFGLATDTAGLAVGDFAVGVLAFGSVLRWTQSMRSALAVLGNILNKDFHDSLNNDFGKQLLGSLIGSVTAIVAFYFAAQTTEHVVALRELGKAGRS